jgi:hypothetical protein
MLVANLGIAVGTVKALPPLLLGALGGAAPSALDVGELGGIEAAPDRLAVDAVLGGEVGETRKASRLRRFQTIQDGVALRDRGSASRPPLKTGQAPPDYARRLGLMAAGKGATVASGEPNLLLV